MKDATGKPVECTVSPSNPDGVGDPTACQILKEELSKTNKNLLINI
jgi:hypothetical protein